MRQASEIFFTLNVSDFRSHRIGGIELQNFEEFILGILIIFVAAVVARIIWYAHAHFYNQKSLFLQQNLFRIFIFCVVIRLMRSASVPDVPEQVIVKSELEIRTDPRYGIVLSA